MNTSGSQNGLLAFPLRLLGDVGVLAVALVGKQKWVPKDAGAWETPAQKQGSAVSFLGATNCVICCLYVSKRLIDDGTCSLGH